LRLCILGPHGAIEICVIIIINRNRVILVIICFFGCQFY